MDMSLSKLRETGKLGVLLFMELQRIRHDLVTNKFFIFWETRKPKIKVPTDLVLNEISLLTC